MQIRGQINHSLLSIQLYHKIGNLFVTGSWPNTKVSHFFVVVQFCEIVSDTKLVNTETSAKNMHIKWLKFFITLHDCENTMNIDFEIANKCCKFANADLWIMRINCRLQPISKGREKLLLYVSYIIQTSSECFRIIQN